MMTVTNTLCPLSNLDEFDPVLAVEEAHVLLFEPAGTLNTGNVRNERTVERPVNLIAP